MARQKKIYTKEELIKKEKNRLKRIFKDMDENRKKMAEGLFEEAAFMKIALQDLKAEVVEEGTVDEMQQGTYKIKREHPALKSYNTMISKYTTTLKILCDMLPKEVPKPPLDDLGDFINSRED